MGAPLAVIEGVWDMITRDLAVVDFPPVCLLAWGTAVPDAGHGSHRAVDMATVARFCGPACLAASIVAASKERETANATSLKNVQPLRQTSRPLPLPGEPPQEPGSYYQ